MNAARLAKSDRLQRVKKLLSDHKPHSTLDIFRKAKVCAVSSIVSELRVNGLDIKCKRMGDVWYYRLT